MKTEIDLNKIKVDAKGKIIIEPEGYNHFNDNCDLYGGKGTEFHFWRKRCEHYQSAETIKQRFKNDEKKYNQIVEGLKASFNHSEEIREYFKWEHKKELVQLKKALENQKNQTADNRELWEESERNYQAAKVQIKNLTDELNFECKTSCEHQQNTTELSKKLYRMETEIKAASIYIIELKKEFEGKTPDWDAGVIAWQAWYDKVNLLINNK